MLLNICNAQDIPPPPTMKSFLFLNVDSAEKKLDLNQWFSNFSLQQNNLEGSIYHRLLDLHPNISDSLGLRLDLQFRFLPHS